MKKTIFLSMIFFCIMSFFLLGQETVLAAPPDRIMRVLIMQDEDSISIYIKDPYKISALGPDSDRVLLQGPCIETTVTAVKEGLVIRGKEFKVGGVRIAPEHNSRIYVNKKIFRGAIDVMKQDNGKLMVINYVGLEEYLYGVLYHEVSHKWPMEALKAQAVAARTFALYQAKQSRNQLYDLRNDVYSQVYGGSDFERWSTTMAVDLTKGKILAYHGDLLPAYYHSTCAGYTEDAANLWKDDLPPLKGVPCTSCCDSAYYKTWVNEIPLWIMETKLRESGYKISKIESVAILSRNKSGRVEKLEIKDSAGVSVILTGKDFRQLVGPNELRSTKFDVSIKWRNLKIEGRGWGHGVGMCQWGAYGMAKEGKKSEEILRYYYPGADIIPLESIKDKL